MNHGTHFTIMTLKSEILIDVAVVVFKNSLEMGDVKAVIIKQIPQNNRIKH